MAKVEPTLAGLQELSRMQRSPYLGMLGREEQQRQRLEIQKRQRQISTVVIDESIQKLGSFEPSLKGLEEIGHYAPRVLGPLQGFADATTLGRFENSLRARDGEIAAAALPEFEARLKELTVAPESPEAARKALEVILAPRRKYAAMAGHRGAIPDYLVPYREATEARVAEIEVALHEAQCDKTLAGTELSPSVRQQAVLGALGPTTVGEFVCRMILTGQEFHSFEAPGLLGRNDYELKVTAQPMGYQTITLHEGAVGPGQEMLVGHTVSDANVKRTLTVQEWQSYAGMLTGQSAEVGLKFLEQLFKGVDQPLRQMQQKSQR